MRSWRGSKVCTGTPAHRQTVTLVPVGEVRAKVDQPTPEERREADQWGSEHTHTVRFLP